MSASNSAKLLGPQPAATGNTVFVYGSLMYPELFHRIMRSTDPDGSQWQIAPATLPSYTRMHVKDRNYPAIVPSQVASSVMQGKTLPANDHTVRGILVKGLTSREVERLDEFQTGYESQDFVRKELAVQPSSSFAAFDSVDPKALLSKSRPVADPASGDAVPAYVYVWDAPTERLSPEPWGFDSFLDERIWKMTDGGSRSDPKLLQWAMAPEGGEGNLIAVQLR